MVLLALSACVSQAARPNVSGVESYTTGSELPYTNPSSREDAYHSRAPDPGVVAADRVETDLTTSTLRPETFASSHSRESSGDAAAAQEAVPDLRADQELHLRDGATVAYRRIGTGPPLLMLHTLRTQSEYFAKVVPFLTADYTVYALDLPGHGRSSLEPVEYDEPYFRAAVREFVESNNLHDVTIVGESLGGVLGLTVATEIPERVRRVVSINPYDYGEKFAGGIRRSRNGWILGLFAVFGSHTVEPEMALRAVLKGGFHDPARLDPQFVRLLYASGRRAGFRRAEYSVYKNWRSWVQARMLYSRVSASITLVYSSFDWSYPVERERNRSELRLASFVTVEDAGHFASLENPRAVAEAILMRQPPSPTK